NGLVTSVYLRTSTPGDLPLAEPQIPEDQRLILVGCRHETFVKKMFLLFDIGQSAFFRGQGAMPVKGWCKPPLQGDIRLLVGVIDHGAIKRVCANADDVKAAGKKASPACGIGNINFGKKM